MTSDQIGILVSVLSALTALLSVIFFYLKSRSDGKAKEQELKHTLDQRIDDRVTQELSRAYGRIDELEIDVDNLKKAKIENAQIKRVVHNWVYRLLRWDRLGREGPMPLPSEEDLILLEIDLTNTSLSEQEIRDLGPSEPTP